MNGRSIWNRFRSSWFAMLGLTLLVAEIAAVLLLPVILRLDPYVADVQAGFHAPPSSLHLLGTDGAARDLLARTLYGGRISLLVGVTAPLISTVIGVPLGLVAGYYRGLAETVIMRLADVFMSFPGVVFNLILVSIIGPSLSAVILVLGVMGWTVTAKLVYGSVLSIREKEYIASAVSIGRSDFDILFHEILPGAASPVLVALSFQVSGAIMQESGLSFLSAGIQPPMASWGNIISEAQDLSVLVGAPWVWIPSSILIVVTMTAFHFVGDGLRDAIDPNLRI